jgi:uncharacterized membrane protein YozB (DUF420 family)
MSESHHPELPEPAPVSPEQIREVQRHVKNYVIIGSAQAALAVVAVIASFVLAQTSFQVLGTLLISLVNGLVIAGILMHLKEEKRTIWKFLIFTGVFFFILFFLTYLARTDLISQTVHNHH